MRFEVLGPMRTGHDDAGVPVAGRLRRGLLALLLARPNEPVTPASLVEALWRDETGERGVARLHLQVHKLRRALDDPARLSYDAAGYRLRVGPGELDAARFEALLDDAAAVTDPRRCAELVRTAMGLWRGRPYDGVDLPDIAAEVHRLGERRLVALEELYTAELRLGRHSAVIGELTGLVGRHPLRERLHWLLVAALYLGGRQADALTAYRHARDTVVAELGIEPGPALRALEARILAGAPVTLTEGTRDVPAQLPHAVSGFVGREEELARLDDLLAAGGDAAPISAVAGTAGVGKTALAVRWAHRAKDRFPDGQLYVDLRGYGPGRPAAPDDVLGTFLRALGQDGAAIPGSLTERAARFRTLVDNKRLLVVLDNARDAGQVRHLLPGASTCFVIVTSRDSLTGLAAREGAHRVDLDRLTMDEAHHMLDVLLGDAREVDPDAAGRLIACCAHLPLALRVAAERIRERRHTPLDDIVAELVDERARLDLVDGDDPQASVRAVFSWSYRPLDTEAARLFRRLGLHPGQDADAYAVAALLGAGDVRPARRCAETLVRAHLLEETADGRYRMHDLLKAYAAELAAATDPEDDRRAAVTRLLEYYLRTAARAAGIVSPHEFDRPGDTVDVATPPLPTFDAAARWLDTERPNLVRGAETAVAWDLRRYPAGLCAALFYYLDFGWYHDDARRLAAAALDVADGDPYGDAYGEGIALRVRGIVHHRTDRFADAAADYTRALTLHEAAGATALRAGTLNTIGNLHLYMGRADDGERFLHGSADLYARAGLPRLAQRPLIGLGLLCCRRGAYETALGYIRRALDLAEEGTNLPVHAHLAYCVAGVHRDLGNHDDALRYARQARALAREARFPFLEGLVWIRLGTIHSRLGHHDEARRHHREAVRIARAMGNTKLESLALNGLGDAHIAAGAPEHAIGCRTDALSAVTNRGSPYEQARAHAGLGDAHELLGHRAEAAGHWVQALRIYRSLRSPRAAGMAERLNGGDAGADS